MAEENEITKKKCGHDEGDICTCIVNNRKPLDVNKYATKKTISQGMLDIALLTANASQLKYILQVGEKHEFYSLMLGLIITSLILQIFQGMIGAYLGTAYNINKLKQQDRANVINNIILASNVLIVALNVILSSFDLKYKFPDDKTYLCTAEEFNKSVIN